MTAITTKNITLPKEVAQQVVTKARDTSTIAALSPSTPMLFKDMTHVLFSKEPEAEFVGEGAQKSASDAEFTAVQGEIHKAQVTVRLSDEVKWADEDSQIGIIDAIVDASSAAIGRALDYGIFHAINPSTGTAASGMTALTAGANQVTATTDASADLDSLVAAVNESYDVDGIAAATSGTVNGALAKTATNVLAILGAFGLIKWGIVRDLGLDVIETGDPDGLGDLKRLNQVAYRTEVAYSWAVLDPKGFAVLKSASA